MKKIAWIGTGVMGHAMVSHLISGRIPGHRLHTHQSQSLGSDAEKATVVDSLAEAVKDADVIISIVGYPQDVESVYATVFEHAKPHTLCIDMTTSSPHSPKHWLFEPKQPGCA
jgi:3-hydroxyisobutyrate dehydrogenase